MSYRVGQVLYVISNKKGQVYPVMIIEEITKKTLKGEEVNYVLQAGADQGSTLLLTQVDGELFETAEEAKKSLISRATEQIEKIVSSAARKAEDWYLSPVVPTEPSDKVHEEDEKDPNVEIVTLPDGTVARLKSAVIL